MMFSGLEGRNVPEGACLVPQQRRGNWRTRFRCALGKDPRVILVIQDPGFLERSYRFSGVHTEPPIDGGIRRTRRSSEVPLCWATSAKWIAFKSARVFPIIWCEIGISLVLDGRLGAVARIPKDLWHPMNSKNQCDGEGLRWEGDPPALVDRPQRCNRWG